MNQQQQELYEKLLKKVNEYCLGYAAEDVIKNIDNLVDAYESKTSRQEEKTYKWDDLYLRPTVLKKSTPLQALDSIIETFIDKDSEDIKTVRTALKALEIFKRNCLLSQYPDGTYELAFTNKIQPTEEDTEILKEVLK